MTRIAKIYYLWYESKKFDELINIFENYEESWSENVEKDMFNELSINNDWYSNPS